MDKKQAEQLVRQILAGLNAPLARHQEMQKLVDVLVMPALAPTRAPETASAPVKEGK